MILVRSSPINCNLVLPNQVGDFFQLSPIHDKTKQFVEDSEQIEKEANGTIDKKKKPYVSQKRAQFCFE
jgi:hypothetical protein